MPKVVILHDATDAMSARALAEMIRKLNVDVLTGSPSVDDLAAIIRDASVIIPLWGPASVATSNLSDELSRLRGRTQVVHALMRRTPVPEKFAQEPFGDISGWQGQEDFPGWVNLAGLVAKFAGVAPLPPPAPKPASGFFQPGRAGEGAPQPAPQQRAPVQAQRSAPQPQRQSAPQPQTQRAAPPPRPPAPQPQRSIPDHDVEPKKGGGMVVIAAVVVVLVAALGGGGYWFMTQNSATATSSAWESVSRDDADELRAFLAGDPGEYRGEAQQALASLEQRSFDNANSANTIEAFEAFLNDFPESEHATRARGRIAELRLQQPATDVVTEEVPLGPETDPDLLPPGTPATTTAPTTPDTTGGPQQITPPDETNTPPADLPTN